MKRFMAILTFVILIAAYWGLLSCGSPVFAQAGCCVERESYSAQWRRNGLSFASCSRLNADRDRDDVYQPAGFVWWNRNCG